MNKYIFFTMNISGINGAEQYIHNKMKYLEENGFQVFVFSGRPGNILIDGFRKFEKLIHPALRFYPSCLNKRTYKKVRKWINSIVDFHPDDFVIIESSNVTSSLWGEAIANDYNCKHLEINLTEHHNYDKDMRDFLEFKLNRHELSGIFDDSTSKMLKKSDIFVRPDMRARAYCNNVVQNCEDRFSHLFDADADLTLGSIGRLEKMYVPLLIDQLIDFFRTNSQKRYNLLLIGGCADKRQLNWIKTQLASCPNVTTVLTGAMYPISKDLIHHVDIFISTSGSSAVTYYDEIPTIRIHHSTAKPLGIIGYDYQLPVTGKILPLEDRNLADCINQIQNNEVAISFIEDFNTKYYERMHAEFARQLHFGDETTKKEYYPVTTIKYKTFLYQLCSIVCFLCGPKIAYAVLEFIRKLVRGAEN